MNIKIKMYMKSNILFQSSIMFLLLYMGCNSTSNLQYIHEHMQTK